MADYPNHFDAVCTRKAWPLIGHFILDIAVVAVGTCLIGEITNSL